MQLSSIFCSYCSFVNKFIINKNVSKDWNLLSRCLFTDLNLSLEVHHQHDDRVNIPADAVIDADSKTGEETENKDSNKEI